MKKSLAILIVLVSSAVGTAQTVAGKTVARPELLYDLSKRDSSITVGIRFFLEPGWYVYWKNPGDSGLPPDVRWELPEGWKASPLQFPVPQKFVYDGLVSYGYKGDVVFLSTITRGSSPLASLKAKLDWLVCKESCLRGSAEVEVPLAENGGRSDLLESAMKKLPRESSEAGIEAAQVRAWKSGAGWEAEIALAGPHAGEVTDFYPDPSESLMVELASIRIAEKSLKFRFVLQEPGPSVTLSGLLITPSGGFQTRIPLDLSSNQ